MAARRRKQRSGRSYAWRYRGRIVACVFVEVLIICALVIMIGWNKGVKEWFEQFEQPVLKEVDISGINSPNAILMQARGPVISTALRCSIHLSSILRTHMHATAMPRTRK